ncbi:2-oxoglutarate dehydrogenase E1 component [Candidatus Aerophobetes bacterium]|uniref:oxoglutarate dehydrogenase (succinyl-transferring) n=1 Tax=Aerophobetes bacterium TaxID=2030807 RepID=A0A2A4X0I5_UNCAE|nr:MAG: 2-oxoglutarate dehydrogenase E1 component [Candidatus Aerophobetes bacterium]
MDKKILDFANLSNLSLIEQMYTKYLEDSSSVDPSWSHFFEGIAFAQTLSHVPTEQTSSSGVETSIAVLIDNYRRYGHFLATTNPLDLESKEHAYQELLSIEKMGFSSADLDKMYEVSGWSGEKEISLQACLDRLSRIYCGNLGVEFMGFTTPDIEQFIIEQMEEESAGAFTREEQVTAFSKLVDTEIFEEFLNKKYPGQKRFSIEGCSLLLPVLSQLLDTGNALDVDTFILGMAHRGRLSVLANLLNKPCAAIFREFDPDFISDMQGRSGDVKYHMGYSTEIEKGQKKIQLELCANPSHLESVDPVVLGRVRARQDLLEEEKKSFVCAVLVHGDASVAGQGVVYETMQMVNLPGYETRGSIHIVVNNQIGFTATEKDTQSTYYATDIAKAFSAPVLHVNGEDVEAGIRAAKLAMLIRQKFHIDVVIEIVGYRKYGHNEGDEPAFTQPVMYQSIRKKTNLREVFAKQMVEAGVLSESEAKAIETQSEARCEESFKNKTQAVISEKEEEKTLVEANPSYMNASALRTLAKRVCTVPADFDLHRKMRRVLDERLAMVDEKGEKNIDWGMAETLAFAALLVFEKVPIRLSGQDSMRGTFAHRQATFFDQTTNAPFTPLAHLEQGQASFEVYNALLSEYAALGFEYGYSLENQKGMTLWEAQFGDFANSAQTIIDQYIVSGYQKWGEKAPLTLLLPHGYEGQGPEHSSARIERFLQLAAFDNIEVFVPSTSASYFQAIFERGLLKTGKPAVIFTPKALLRFAPSLSSFETVIERKSLPVICDEKFSSGVKKLIFCSGKVAYDLREARGDKKIAIVTLERLYPFPKEEIAACIEQILGKKSSSIPVLWVQEEHQNMGCWEFVKPRLEEIIGKRANLQYVGRAKSASTSAGSKALHLKELNQFVKEAMDVL